MLRRLQNNAKINTYLRYNAKSVQGVSSQGEACPHCLQRRKSLIFNPYHGIFSFVLSIIHVDRFEKRNFRSGGFWEPNTMRWSNQHIFWFTKSWIKSDSIRFFPERRSVLTVSRHTISRNLASGSANISRIPFALPRRGKKNIYKNKKRMSGAFPSDIRFRFSSSSYNYLCIGAFLGTSIYCTTTVPFWRAALWNSVEFYTPWNLKKLVPVRIYGHLCFFIDLWNQVKFFRYLIS